MALAPKVNTDRSADAFKAFPVSTVAANLTTQQFKPPFAPQQVLLVGSATVGACTLVDEETRSHTIAVPVNGQVLVRMPITTLTTDANCTALAMWWERGAAIAPGVNVSARNP